MKSLNLSNMKTFYFTFGSGQYDIIGGQPRALNRSFTTIEAEDFNRARAQMFERRGPKFCTHYDSAEEAGVERWGLMYIPFDEITSQPGPTE